MPSLFLDFSVPTEIPPDRKVETSLVSVVEMKAFISRSTLAAFDWYT
jgi:hypothetical protein